MRETHDKVGSDNHSICHVEQLSHLLNDESSKQEALTIIKSLIDRSEIALDEKQVDPQVPLVEVLRRCLSWRYLDKKSHLKDRGVGRVFMVGGACNRRYLHLDFAKV